MNEMNWLIDEVSQHKLCSLVNLINMYFDTNPSIHPPTAVALTQIRIQV